MFKENSFEKKEDMDFVSFNKIARKLGQTQYVSIFVNPNPRLHEEGEPYFSEFRIQGNPDNYYDFKIHTDDIVPFIKKWFEYKKERGFFGADRTLEEFIPEGYEK